MEHQMPPDLQIRPFRPKMLTVLCILTFIWSGINVFSSAMIYSFHEEFKIAVEETATSFNIPNWEIFVEVPRNFFLASALISIGVIAGAARMWRLRKAGFHIYTISQILLILSYMYFYQISSPPFFDIITGALFVYLYSRFLKFME